MSTFFIISSALYSRSFLLPSKISFPPPPHISSSPSAFQWPETLFSPSPFLLCSSSTYRRFIPKAINLHSEDPSDPATSYNLDRIVAVAHNLFDDLPQPVKKFPWAKTMENYFRLVFDLACAAAKFLSVPILAVSSLSEMSYCGHERKLALVPFSFLIGFFLAGVVADTAIEVSVGVKEGDFPWHLFMVAALFLLLKLPGPYYPYWGRLVVPHFANGGLWRIVWRVFLWYRRVGINGVQTGTSGRDGSL